MWLAPHALGSRLVTNAEWRQFLTDGGYQMPGLWLSDGWTWVRQNAIEAPLYWCKEQGEWSLQFTLAGLAPLDADAPVRHVSFYEAEAFAR